MPEGNLPNTRVFSLSHITVLLCLGQETALEHCTHKPFQTAKSPTKSIGKKGEFMAVNRWGEGHSCTVGELKWEGRVLLSPAQLGMCTLIGSIVLPFDAYPRMTAQHPEH